MHEAPGTAEGFFFHFSITADTTVILQLSFLKVRFLAKPIDASIMGLLAYEIVPLRAELFPPDGLLFFQGRQFSSEFVTPL